MKVEGIRFESFSVCFVQSISFFMCIASKLFSAIYEIDFEFCCFILYICGSQLLLGECLFHFELHLNVIIID